MSDIVFHDSYMTMFIEKSKTDIYRNGNWRYLAKLKSKLCSMTLLRRYMKLSTAMVMFSEAYVKVVRVLVSEKKTCILQDKMC